MSSTPELPTDLEGGLPSGPDKERAPTDKRKTPVGSKRRARRATAPAGVAEVPMESETDPLVALIRDFFRADGVSYGISVALHVVLLAVLGVIVLRNHRPKVLPTTLRGFHASGINDESKRPARSPVQFETPAAEEVIEKGPGSKTAPPSENLQGETAAVTTKPAEVNVAGALAGRTIGDPDGRGGGEGGAGGRSALLAAQGGTDKTEQAVAAGLNWVVRQQKADGHWELHQGYPDSGQLRTNTGATALAMLTLLGAGHTHRDGPYKEKVSKGLLWLRGVQKKSGTHKGDFYDFDREGDAASFYSHGQALIALCEAYALTRDAEMLPSIQEGLTYLYDAQHPKTGGWKYRRQSEGDLSVFGWQIMALQTARMAGIEVSTNVLDRAGRFLELVSEENGARYRYDPREQKPPTLAMTAEGLLCRQYLGWPRNHPALQAGVAYLVQPENLPKWNSGRRNIYHWYYASQVLHNMQGSDWETWNEALRAELVENQVKGVGKVGGSWHPFQPSGAADENADKGGRLYITCLCLLTLEVYYRHLPLYRDHP